MKFLTGTMLLFGMMFILILAEGQRLSPGRFMIVDSMDNTLKGKDERNTTFVLFTTRNTKGREFHSWVKNLTLTDPSNWPIALVSGDDAAMSLNAKKDKHPIDESTFYNNPSMVGSQQQEQTDMKDYDTCRWWVESTRCTCWVYRYFYHAPIPGVTDDYILVDAACLELKTTNLNIRYHKPFRHHVITSTGSGVIAIEDLNATSCLLGNETKCLTRNDPITMGRGMVYLTVLCMFWTLVIGF